MDDLNLKVLKLNIPERKLQLKAPAVYFSIKKRRVKRKIRNLMPKQAAKS